MRRILLMIPFSLSAGQQKPSLTLQRARQERIHFEGLLKQQKEMSQAQKMALDDKIKNQITSTRRMISESGKTNPKLGRALTGEVAKLLKLITRIW